MYIYIYYFVIMIHRFFGALSGGEHTWMAVANLIGRKIEISTMHSVPFRSLGYDGKIYIYIHIVAI